MATRIRAEDARILVRLAAAAGVTAAAALGFTIGRDYLAAAVVIAPKPHLVPQSAKFCSPARLGR